MPQPLNIILGSMDLVEDGIAALKCDTDSSNPQGKTASTLQHRGARRRGTGPYGHLVVGGGGSGADPLALPLLVPPNTPLEVITQEPTGASQAAIDDIPDPSQPPPAASPASLRASPVHELEVPSEEHTVKTENDAVNELLTDVQSVMRAARTLRRQVDDLLEFQKLTRGKISWLPQDVDLANLIEQLLSEHQYLSSVPLIAAIGPHLPDSLYLDDLRVRQLITNGLTNAIKHTKQGSIEIHAEFTPAREEEEEEGSPSAPPPFPMKQRQSCPSAAAAGSRKGGSGRFSCRSGCCCTRRSDVLPMYRVNLNGAGQNAAGPPPRQLQGYLQITVHDTGEGLQGTDPEELFKPFTEVTNRRSGHAVIGSTGLGLPICRMLLHHMGGEVALVPRNGHNDTGCDFVFAFPVYAKPPPPPEKVRFTTHAVPRRASRGPRQSPTIHLIAGPGMSSKESTQENKHTITEPTHSRETLSNPAAGRIFRMSALGTGRKHESFEKMPSLGGGETSPGSGTGRSISRLWEYVNGIPAGRVLVVDDSATNARLASRIVARVGSTASVVSPSNKSFLSALKEKLIASGQYEPHGDVVSFAASSTAPFVCILIDMSLDKENGLDIVTALRPRLRQPFPYFVAMTGAVASEDLQRYKAAGLAGCLPKPFTTKSMAALAKHVFPGKPFWPDDPAIAAQLYD